MREKQRSEEKQKERTAIANVIEDKVQSIGSRSRVLYVVIKTDTKMIEVG